MFFFDETKAIQKTEITKRAHTFKNYLHSYNIEFLNSCNLQLQFKYTELTIKNRLKGLLNELRGFKFVIILV